MRSHEHIKLMTYSEVAGVSGYVGNFKVQIRRKARYVDEAKCTGCGDCSRVCPVEVDSEFEQGLSKRKAIYIPFAQAVPNKATIDAANCSHMKGLARGRDNVCGLCKIGNPKKNQAGCQSEAIDFDQKDQIVDLEVGNIILTTGFQQFDPSVIYQYGYGRYPNVVAGLTFERMSSASGPTNGEIRLANGKKPESIAILHCVGSRDVNYHEYCSRVCCMYSLKFSHLLREKLPDAKVYQMYIDMRCFGKGYEEFYERLQEEGVNFVRGRAGEVTNIAESPAEQGKLVVLVEDTLIRKKRRIPVDMVVLSTALEPRDDAADVARMFSISRSKDGFFLEKHPKLDPVATTTDGVFVAGCCQGPKDIPDTVAQASAAAARVLAVISKGTVQIESAISSIDEKLCSGCQTCIALCPYTAISYDAAKKVSVINEALCKGCGTCAAACPSGAITSRHFTAEQIMAQLEGVLS